jgi:hypothetical protein
MDDVDPGTNEKKLVTSQGLREQFQRRDSLDNANIAVPLVFRTFGGVTRVVSGRGELYNIVGCMDFRFQGPIFTHLSSQAISPFQTKTAPHWLKSYIFNGYRRISGEILFFGIPMVLGMSNELLSGNG